MHSFLRMRSALWVGFCALALTAIVAGVAEAKPRPGNPNKGFRLFARPLGAMVINRIYCGLSSGGEICVDSTNSSTIGGGFWPKGTADQYVFNSGIQVAGIIGPDANPEWQGDTTGAQFFSPRGDNVGEEFRPIFNASNPDDVANWPEAAKVPSGDASQELFNPLLRGRVSASQSDVWFLSWEGNPAFSAGREHPLGVLIEQRGLGYNFPSGNEDILYFIYTFYNVTARDPAAYAAVRPGMREILVEAGNRFQDLNEQRSGISIPETGYTISNFFAAFGADMDVSEAGANFASVNVPFSLGYTYEHTFSPAAGWTFDPSIFSPPFFAGSGFVGVKYLKSPLDPVTGQEVGLTLFSNTINGGAFDDAANVTQLYRYISNNISVAAGDAACNTGDPRATKICYINNGQEDDMRFFQASGPLNLAPGGFGSIVVAYIFAAPRIVGACTGAGTCDLKPGDPTRLNDVTRLLSEGANAIDSVSGYVDFRGPDPSGNVVQDSITVLPGSLLGKALVAQEVFRNQFLLPFSPEPPDFFLIPGSDQVSVLWQPSASETVGDPFFAIANSPTTAEGGINPLYDPNYRNQDVEGYRVYRGRVDSPNSLQLLAQYDYAGTLISDFQGQVNPTDGCAPEIAITTTCAAAFDPVVPGVARTVFVDVPLVGPITQVKLGDRAALATGTAILLKADTAVTGRESGCLTFGNGAACELHDSGVPFVFVDETARNNLRYFYAVTAFDINSFQSGPSSLESPRVTKAVTPVANASNHQNTADVTVSMQGRGVVLNNTAPLPTLDPATGRFSGPMPPANDFEFGLAEFVQTLLAAPGSFSLTLDSIGLGSAYDGIPNFYYFTGASGATVTQVTLPITQDPTNLTASNFTYFTAISPDDALAQRFGGSDEFKLTARILMNLRGNYYTNSWGRGCVNAAGGFAASASLGVSGCEYNGQRWFDGPSPANNETVDDPQATHPVNASGSVMVPAGNYNNAGTVTGATTVHIPHSYETQENFYRQVEGGLGGVARAADFNVYWGAAGLIDSVIDATHNVVVPFAPTIGSSFGVLNQAAGAAGGSIDTRGGVLTSADMGCVAPWNTFPNIGAGGLYNCTAAAPYALSQTAVPGPVAIYDGNSAAAATKAPQAGPGFILYLPGAYTVFESPVPAQGAVWTLRTYVGSIRGGQGGAGDRGPYVFTPRPGGGRPLTATGVTLQVDYDVVNQVVAATETDLGQVHTVPDPYYVTNAFEQTTDSKIIKFVNLPAQAIIRIYSSSGVLVALLEHNSSTFGGSEDWNARNRNNQVVASGVYFFHIESGGARRVGRFTVVNFAQ
ncbi:MAG TPA: T9SS type A sorting domain-containing protein [Gemmatimonadales bacterium]